MTRRGGRSVRARAGALALLCAGAALPLAAPACGVCVDDKVAAAYDHAVVTRALAAKRRVVFASMEGRAAAPDLARAVKAAAGRVRGVERGSVRAAENPAALSFVVDGSLTPQAALAAVARACDTPGVRLTLLKVLP